MSELDTSKRLSKVVRHIRNVQQAADILAEQLIEEEGFGFEFAKQLVARSLVHDNSKLINPIEWEYLHDECKEENPTEFALAWKTHVMTNDHHPEYWGGINAMPSIATAEMVCDLHARSAEMGTDLWKFIKTDFMKTHNVSPQGKKYKEMKGFIDLLLVKPFS